jgi:hypothetical protein
MANKKQVLGVLSRRHLQQLVSSHELKATDRRSMDALVQALMGARRVKTEDVLSTLSLAELQDVAEKLVLPSGPRQKAKLIAHIAAAKPTSGAGRSKKTTKKAPARKASKKKVANKAVSKRATKKKPVRRKKTTARKTPAPAMTSEPDAVALATTATA